MSLIRQIALLLGATLLLAFGASAVVGVQTTRQLLQTQLELKNADNAAALALTLSQQKGEPERMALLLAAQFDTGFYRRIRFEAADGATLFERRSEAAGLAAPAWFVALTPIRSVPGTAQVSDGWRALGAVEVESHTAFVHDALWRGSLRSVAALAIVCVLVGLFGALLVGRLRRPLERTVAQANAIERGEYLTLAEPRMPELARVTRAMNSMVARLKTVFEAQAAQVETLRAAAHVDPLTGLSNRAHFVGRLAGLLSAEDGAASCGLVLLRVADLADVNRTLGREITDDMLRTVARTLQTYAQQVDGCFVGRLNSSDFALGLPVAGVAIETAQAVIDVLRVVLPGFGARIAVAAGAGESGRGASVAGLLSTTDLALARAENQGGFFVEAVVGPVPGRAPAVAGATAWRTRVRDALEAGRSRLGSFPVVDALQRVVHLECPLRLQLDADGGAYEVAAVWLPWAVRARLTPLADERALALALAEIRRDGRPRCVNVSPSSLRDSGFAGRLRDRLADAPREAALLSVEVAEVAAVDGFDAVQELGRRLRPTGVRFGLEHAGERLSRLDRLFELGLDYVKLGDAVTTGIADAADRAGFVTGLVVLLHGLSLQVYAEGVADAADARALWDCGVDGLTGPWVTATLGDAPA